MLKNNQGDSVAKANNNYNQFQWEQNLEDFSKGNNSISFSNFTDAERLLRNKQS